MNISLDALEQRIDQLLLMCGDLHHKNESLRVQTASLAAEKLALEQKVDTAASHLEALMEHLPAE